MNTQRFEQFERFSRPQYLQLIGRGRVTALLMPFARELLGHGIALPARGLSDDLFFMVLAALPLQQGTLSAGLLEVMTAIDEMGDRLPDERAALVVSEIRLQLSDKAPPVLLVAEPRLGTGPRPGTEPQSGNESRVPGLTGNLNPEMESVCGNARPTVTAEATRPYCVMKVAPETAGASGGAPAARGSKTASRYKFVRRGSVYAVRYDGMDKFHLAVTDGARYADVLLHEPNILLHCLELERRVKPYKAAARGANSAQKAMDAQALRALRAKLQELEEDMAEAEAQGAVEWATQLEGEIGAIKKCLVNNATLGSDSGERARNNVRKAIGKLIAKLRKGGPAEQAFGRHLEESISLGYEVIYVQPAGRVWE